MTSRLFPIPLCFVAAMVSLAACSSDESPPSAPRSSTRQAIVNGTASTAAQDYVVQIGIIGSKGKMIPHCTGTMIAKNLVITARHCVGDVSDVDASVVDFASSRLSIFTGLEAGAKTVSSKPEATGTKTFDIGTKELTPDIAVVLLDKPLDVPIAPVRLDSRVTKGEVVDVIGFGVNQTSSYPQQRQQRKGLKVAAIGPSSTTFFDLFKGEFQFGEAACSGDSGGPAIDASTGALVGIASRVSNGTDRVDTDPAASCVGATTEDVYTDLTPAATFIRAAFDAAGAEPWIEGEPSPEEKAAAAAAAAEEEQKRKAAEDQKAAAAADDSGCAVTTTRPSEGAGSALLLLLVLSFTQRRTRRAL